MQCPVCKSELNIFGSECYPEDGFVVECPKCIYELRLSVNLRISGLKSIVMKVQEIVNEIVQEVPVIPD